MKDLISTRLYYKGRQVGKGAGSFPTRCTEMIDYLFECPLDLAWNQEDKEVLVTASKLLFEDS